MLRKLLKYDLRSMLKSFLLIWCGMMVLALINHFTLNNGGRLTGTLATISTVLPMLLYVGIFIAMVVLAVLFIIQRFYNGLLKDEGYLMFTLPVKPWQLITSKGLSAVVVLFLSTLVGAASILLMLPWSESAAFFRALAHSLSGNQDFASWQMILMLIEVVILVLLSIAKSIYQVYASIALGHLFRSHRVGMAFVMYIVISAAISGIFSAAGSLIYRNPDSVQSLLQSIYRACGANGSIQVGILTLFLLTAVQLVLFHVITERILSKRLNLE